MVHKADPAVSWKNLLPLLGGAGLAFLIIRLFLPSVPPSSDDGEYTFQPELRRPKFNLGVSNGALGGLQSAAPVPSLETASCKTLQEFANYEYDKRYRKGKVADLMTFSGFDGADVFVTGRGTLNCSGGEFLRTGKRGKNTCKNIILSYDTATNTLSYNIQYLYLERGLQPECTGPI